MVAPDSPIVDTPRADSLSFAPPAATDRDPAARIAGRAPVGPPGPGRLAAPAPKPADDEDVTGYPVQVAKVERPPLRAETLARGRLLDWLAAKIHHRVVLLIAEAGYGKTTLLADFSRRTRVRTLWYRMDDTDRGWAAFIAHLVTAGRQHIPDFAPITHQLLAELGPTGPSRDAVVNTFLRELPAIGASGCAIILDDFHLVDDSEEVISVTRDLLARAQERVTLVIASRRRPTLPLARLRAQGEIAELTREDLRFDIPETESLFRDAYRHPLDADSARELAIRTEGWAASLQLVEAAVRGRGARETRAFIHSLSAAVGDLYDYLAEEVVGHLPPELQQFLMRVSLLETVDPELATVVTSASLGEARLMIAAAERSGLLARRGDARRTFRFHPLVREFLLDRLTREESADRIRDLHRLVAMSVGSERWQIACAHLVAADDVEAVGDVLDGALGRILATGQYDLAARYLITPSGGRMRPTAAVVLSRISLDRDDFHAALEFARAAVALRPEDDRVVANLVGILVSLGELEEARQLASELLNSSPDPLMAGIAHLTVGLIDASVAGPMAPVLHEALEIADKCRAAGSKRYEGIALLNAAELLRAMGRADEALETASAARIALTPSNATEIPTTVSIRAWALAKSGRLGEARREVDELRRGTAGPANLDLLTEFGGVESIYGLEQAALNLVDEAEALGGSDALEVIEKIALVRAQVALRLGSPAEAQSWLDKVRPNSPSGVPGREAWRLALEAHLAVVVGSDDSHERVRRAFDHAQAQGAQLGAAYCVALSAVLADGQDMAAGILAAAARDRSALSCIAELVASRISSLHGNALSAVTAEMEFRPERWRPCLRRLIDEGAHVTRFLAGRALNQIGEAEDVGRLRRLARLAGPSSSDRDLGRGLARLLARRVFVEDLGRVQVLLDGEPVPGRRIRRKVLALLCLLLTRRAFAAPRDEVIDVLWPDMDLEDGLNSLNQTIYFLRRVFEPEFVEDLSPGYVHHDSELVWLDRELVDARSAKFERLLASVDKVPSPEDIEKIGACYSDRFAIDFSYEDWASAYRDRLHAAYLHAMEEGIRLDLEAGHFEHGIQTARQSLGVDPQALQIEQWLLRLYRLTGAHSAASEQYGHYSTALRRDLEIEAPPLESM